MRTVKKYFINIPGKADNNNQNACNCNKIIKCAGKFHNKRLLNQCFRHYIGRKADTGKNAEIFMKTLHKSRENKHIFSVKHKES